MPGSAAEDGVASSVPLTRHRSVWSRDLGRIHEKNPRFRTREQMSSDAAIALRSEMSHGGKHSVLHGIMWAWTEFYGKYRGCPLWTPKAIVELSNNPLPDSKKFRHEHSVPKQLIMDMLFELADPTADRVHELLSGLLFGVVVTRDEDDALNVDYRRTMPPEFHEPGSPEFMDPWLRYKRCGITVVNRTDGDRIVIGSSTANRSTRPSGDVL
ncbi:MAG: hypothetical protein AAGA55_08535 [Planctomycetota bacterium]